ncbi:DUF4179 domain-containing protein [Brevibacillus ruminantium]|uniref:Anti-sigma-W factor RsiW n=1 Tax=Brevibacillus ruminantium TaxID=2950604 RepID=A0ABY4WFB5_9BACL|nr:DUF4179 domain-containing protein [Brevibacillus ruminantium]USG65718.1 DUF4179 domain-containing protein [Brevibacillus ruminantium]
MKCQACQALLPAFVDGETGVTDERRVKAHLQHCRECQALYARLNEENGLIRDGWSMEMLPDDFAKEVMQQIEDEGIEVERTDERLIKGQELTRQRSRKVVHKKGTLRISYFVTAAVLFISLGAVISPAFASFLSSFFQTMKGELGLRQAVNQGYSTEINQTVSDNGITLRVKEVVADPTRIVLSYVLEDSNGQILPDLYLPSFGSNKIFVTDQEGKVIPSYAVFRRTSNYADLMFPLQDPQSQVIVHFEIKAIGSIKQQPVNLNMSIPVDLSQGKAATKQVTVSKQYTNANGIDVEMRHVTYAPSATQIHLRADWSKSSKETLLQQVEELKAKKVKTDEAISLLTDYSIGFTIEDKEGKILADSRKNNYEAENGLIYTYMKPDELQPGIIEWYHSFAPFGEHPEDVFFHLDEMIVTQKAEFSLAIPLHDKGKWGGEYEGNYYEVQEVNEEKPVNSSMSSYILTIDSILKIDDFPKWFVTDTEGRAYEVEYDLEKTNNYSNSKGDHTVQTLIVKEVPKGVNELMLGLVSVKKQLPKVDWKIKLPR